MKRNPRVAQILMEDRELLHLRLPEFTALQVFDLYMENTTLGTARAVGATFLDSLEPKYGDLVHVWRRSHRAEMDNLAADDTADGNTSMSSTSKALLGKDLKSE